MSDDTKGKTLAKIFDDLVSKGDFKKALTVVIKNVLGFEKKLTEQLMTFSEGFNATLTDSITRIEASLSARFDTLQKGRDGKDGRDGVDGKQGPQGIRGRDGSPDTGEKIISKINSDNSGKKIKREKVEGLSEIEDMAKRADANVRNFGAGGNFIYVADLSSQTDGNTKTFTVPSHSRGIMVIGSDFPTILFKDNGYTEPTATTILLTTDNAPSTGSQLGYMYVLI